MKLPPTEKEKTKGELIQKRIFVVKARAKTRIIVMGGDKVRWGKKKEAYPAEGLTPEVRGGVQGV